MIRSKKKLAVFALISLIAIGGVALAYWTTTGSGEGSADVKNTNGTLTLQAIFASDALAPGLSTPVNFTADSTSATNLWVETISLTSVTVDAGHSTCAVGDFSMAPVTSQDMVPAGATGEALNGTGTLMYANSAVNQDACKGATITLHVDSV